MSQIIVNNLQKHYSVHKKEAGIRGSLKAFFNRQYEQIKAVDEISFTIQQGEIVGFLGPNGAGKTTTLKLLSGLLYPTAGEASVLGFTPHKRDRAFLEQFTLVMGNKNQLLWDLPAMESFLINKAIYAIPSHTFNSTLKELDQLLNLEPLLKKQVRKLSLGERMKCELAAALLHQPKVLFLDEPTIGLDVTMQAAIREFVAAYNQKHEATIILTSHYMADVTALTQRVIVIHNGRLLYDGNLQKLIAQIAPYKLLTITLRDADAVNQLLPFGQVEKIDGIKATIRVPRGEASQIAAQILTGIKVDDLLIEEPAVEEIIRQIFNESATITLS